MPFFRYPFAVSGNKTAIPETTQLDGTVSYQQGYGPDYSADRSSDPDALTIERTKWNQLMYDITTAVRAWQTDTYPDFITAAENGGTAYAYPAGAIVRYDNSGYKYYRSKVGTNTELPTNTTNWEQIEGFSTNAQATTGTNTTTSMTPASTKAATDAVTSSILGTVASTYAPLASPALTGIPTAPTAIGGTNTTQLATTQFVQSAVSGVTGFLPTTGGSLSGALNLAKGSDIASASTTSIGSATGNYVHITGTTTITSFGTAPQAGTTRILDFDGALTLTNGANLVLPGAANITTAAGDRAVFVADTTTKWVCVSYTRANGQAVVTSGINLQTEVATTSGTTVNLSTAIPSGVKRITVSMVGVSTNGSANILLQVGDSGGFETTGYTSGSNNSDVTTVTTSTAGFVIGVANAANILHGNVVFNKSSTNSGRWTATGTLYSESGLIINLAGSKTLSEADVTQLRLNTSNGTDTFDAGSASISWEF